MRTFDYSRDAQQLAMSFLMQQGTLIEPTVYAMKYREIQYAELVPVDTSAPEWIQSVTYFSTDAVGKAQWFAGKAQDVPHVELTREKFQTGVQMAAIGYDYTLEEVQTAQFYGVNLTSDKAAMARRAAEEFIDSVAFIGSATKGYKGLVNNASATATSAPADGTAGSRNFSAKTPDQILRDINVQLAGIGTDTLYTELADTILMPYDVLLDISTRRIDQVNQTTILQWLMTNNIYTLRTGQRLTIRGLTGILDTAGTGNTKRMVFYRRSPEVLKMHLPMPYRFLPVWQSGPMSYEIPGIFRLGGVDVRRPKAVRYLDQV